MTQSDQYGNSKLVSGGGWGLKHNAHLRLQFSSGNDVMDDIFVVQKHSSIDLIKSKISPLFTNITFVIDVREGGVVDPVLSMLLYARNQLGYITTDAWAKMPRPFEMHPEYDGKFDKYCKDGKSFRWTELVEYARERPKLITLLQLCFIDEICDMYKYQAVICQKYREELIRKLEEPEPFEDENGRIIDRWTGEIMNSDAVIVDEHSINNLIEATNNVDN